MRNRGALSGLLFVAAMLGGCTDGGAQAAQPQISGTPTAASEPSRSTAAPIRTPDRRVVAEAAPGTALAQLAALAVKGRAAMTGYEREAYGQAWADVDRNGCDTRNDVLRRDLRDVVAKPGTRDCVVQIGRLAPDPYTGADIAFERGGANEVDIDHVVPLANSWVTGASYWDEPKRIAFGNDPANLLAVDSSANRQKGSGDAATWLPARKAYRCAYVARQVGVKAKYELWVTPAEKDAIARLLGDCPAEPAIEAGSLEVPPAGRGAAASQSSAPTAAPVAVQAADPRFPYCKDAIAAGYGPYQRSRVEYDWYRDADGDGVVCEG